MVQSGSAVGSTAPEAGLGTKEDHGERAVGRNATGDVWRPGTGVEGIDRATDTTARAGKTEADVEAAVDTCGKSFLGVDGRQSADPAAVGAWLRSGSLRSPALRQAPTADTTM